MKDIEIYVNNTFGDRIQSRTPHHTIYIIFFNFFIRRKNDKLENQAREYVIHWAVEEKGRKKGSKEGKCDSTKRRMSNQASHSTHTQLVTTPFPKGVSFLKLGTVIFCHAAQNFTTKTISVRSSCALYCTQGM